MFYCVVQESVRFHDRPALISSGAPTKMYASSMLGITPFHRVIVSYARWLLSLSPLLVQRRTASLYGVKGIMIPMVRVSRRNVSRRSTAIRKFTSNSALVRGLNTLYACIGRSPSKLSSSDLCEVAFRGALRRLVSSKGFSLFRSRISRST